MNSVWTGEWPDQRSKQSDYYKEDGFVIYWIDGEEPKNERKSEYKRSPPLDLEKLIEEFKSKQNSSEH